MAPRRYRCTVGIQSSTVYSTSSLPYNRQRPTLAMSVCFRRPSMNIIIMEMAVHCSAFPLLHLSIRPEWSNGIYKRPSRKEYRISFPLLPTCLQLSAIFHLPVNSVHRGPSITGEDNKPNSRVVNPKISTWSPAHVLTSFKARCYCIQKNSFDSLFTTYTHRPQRRRPPPQPQPPTTADQ